MEEIKTLAEFGVTKHEKVLQNGLPVIFIENPFSPIYAKIAIGAGSVFNSSDNGLAHMTEHLLAGSKNTSKDEFHGIIESIGGYRNMYTSKEWISVNTEVAEVSQLPSVAKFFSEALESIYVTPEFLRKEKEVIFSEIQRNLNQRRFYKEGLHLVKNLVGDSPWLNSNLGTVEGMRGLKIGEIRSFFQKHCVVENMLLVVAGGCELEDIEKTFSKINFLHGQKIELPSSPEVVPVGQRLFYEKDSPQTTVVFGFNGPQSYSADSAVLNLAMAFAHHGMTSRFYRKIRGEKSLAYSVDDFSMSFNKTKYVGTEVGVPKEKVDETIDTLIECYNEFLAEGISEQELKNKIDTWWFSVKRAHQTSASWVGVFDDLYDENRIVKEFPDIYRFRKSITPDDINRVLQKYIKLDEFHLHISGAEPSKKYF